MIGEQWNNNVGSRVPVIHSEHFAYMQLKNLTWSQLEVIQEDSNISFYNTLGELRQSNHFHKFPHPRQVVIAGPKPMPCWASAVTVRLEIRVLPVPRRFPKF